MRGKLILVAGLATGYILGSRAGRARYDQIAAAAGRLWHSGSVQHQVHNVEDAARTQAPLAVDLLGVVLKRLVGKSSTRRNAAAFSSRGRGSAGRGAGSGGSAGRGAGSPGAGTGSNTATSSGSGSDSVSRNDSVSGNGTGSGPGNGSGSGLGSGSGENRSATDRSTSI